METGLKTLKLDEVICGLTEKKALETAVMRFPVVMVDDYGNHYAIESAETKRIGHEPAYSERLACVLYGKLLGASHPDPEGPRCEDVEEDEESASREEILAERNRRRYTAKVTLSYKVPPESQHSAVEAMMEELHHNHNDGETGEPWLDGWTIDSVREGDLCYVEEKATKKWNLLPFALGSHVSFYHTNGKLVRKPTKRRHTAGVVTAIDQLCGYFHVLLDGATASTPLTRRIELDHVDWSSLEVEAMWGRAHIIEAGDGDPDQLIFGSAWAELGEHVSITVVDGALTHGGLSGSLSQLPTRTVDGKLVKFGKKGKSVTVEADGPTYHKLKVADILLFDTPDEEEDEVGHEEPGDEGAML